MAGELGVCPAARPGPHSGMNGGAEGGRICWSVAGTLCDGKVRGSFASKRSTCTDCEVFKRVQQEEGERFHLLVPASEHHALYEQFVAITSIINSMNAIVYAADLETHELLFLNPYAEKLFGSRAIGARCFDVLQKGQTGPCSFCTNKSLLVDGQPGPPVVWEFQNTVTHRWFQCIDRAIRWWDGRLVRMEIAFDITERKEADRFREQYVGLVSHDLRNPLNGILLNAQALRRSAHKHGMDQECPEVEYVISSATRMNALIADLLETTRLESGRLELRLEPIEMQPWVQDVVRRTIIPASRDRIIVQPAASPVRAFVDRDKLERVLENLLSNALKYSGEASVDVAIRQEEGSAVVSVVDHGSGVPAEDLPHVFDRFFRGSQSNGSGGLGLGLYNARLIVEAHGGRIWAESPPGQGAEFYFSLPSAC